VSTLELVYFDGCPHWRTAHARLEQVAAEHDLTVALRPVTSEDAGSRLLPAGSPTVLIDGRDPFPERGAGILWAVVPALPNACRGGRRTHDRAASRRHPCRRSRVVSTQDQVGATAIVPAATASIRPDGMGSGGTIDVFSQSSGRWREHMTQQYLAGELSMLLARLQAVTPSVASAGEVAQLRREAETLPTSALAPVTARALELADGLCWKSLIEGDTDCFGRLAVVGAQLREFGVCAGMLVDG